MKFKYILLAILLCILGAGCSKAPELSTASADPAKTDLAAKLQAMTPEQRAKYVQEHPEEVNATFSQAPVGSPSSGQ